MPVTKRKIFLSSCGFRDIDVLLGTRECAFEEEFRRIDLSLDAGFAELIRGKSEDDALYRRLTHIRIKFCEGRNPCTDDVDERQDVVPDVIEDIHVQRREIIHVVRENIVTEPEEEFALTINSDDV